MGPIKEHVYILYQFELTDFMSSLNSLGILVQFVFLRTDLGLGDCFFSVSTLFCVQRKVAIEILPCGLTLATTSITHHQVTPIPDLGSEHIHGISQVICRMEPLRDEVPFRVSMVGFPGSSAVKTPSAK